MTTTGTFYIDSLVAPDPYRWNANAPGTPLTVTYGFMTTMPAYVAIFNPPNESGPFQAFTAAQRAGVERAVALFESVANIDLVFRADGDNAQIRFGSAVLDPGEAAHTYYPEPSGDWAGDIWFNSDDQSLYNQSAGTYGFMATLHEMGHALGLKHSFDDGSGDGPALPDAYDNRQFTVMSYDKPADSSVEPSSLMLYDIAALQYLYGANMTTALGDTTYRWLPDEEFLTCIWDAGGNDTIDASNQTRTAVIDLRAGNFSSIGSRTSGVVYTVDAWHNVGIAYGCIIENAIGGSNTDWITGNDVANRLEGRGGDDRIDGLGGNDVIFGDSGADSLSGGDGDDTLYGGTENDILHGNAGRDTLYGEDGNDSLEGEADDDVLSGGAGDDTLSGGAGNDVLSGGIGNDTLLGDDGDDQLSGDAGADTLRGGAGNDVLRGGADADILDGGDGTNSLYGDAGDDTFIAWNGADRFDGGDGFDVVSYADNWGYFVLDLKGGTSSGVAQGDTFFGIEKIIGGAGGTTFIGGGAGNWFVGGQSDDLFIGGSGADRFDGGGGFLNAVSYASSASAVFIDLGVGTASGGDAQGDVLLNIQRVIGSSGNDTLVAGGGMFRQRLEGGEGNDRLEGATALLVGGRGDDLYIDPAINDSVVELAGEGYDEVRTRYDRFRSSGNIEKIVYTGTGSFEAYGSSGAEWIIGGSGNDNLNGLEGDDTLDGGGGDDVLRPGTGAGQVIGGSGFDTVSYDDLWTTAVTINLATGVNGGGAAGQQFVSIEAVTGSFVDDAITGDAGANRLDGGGGNDTINGGGGDDTIIGGAGNDTIDGGAGNDTVVYSGAASDYIVSTQNGVTTVTAKRSSLQTLEGTDQLTNVETVLFSNARPNQLPFLSVLNSVVPRTGSVAASALTQYGDQDGDAAVAYEFRDPTQGGGYFTLNGAAQPANQTINVLTADLDTVRFFTAGGSDVVQIRVFDGVDWSVWKDFTLIATNYTPVVHRNFGTYTPAHSGGGVSVSGLFSVTDVDGDPVVQYEFRDDTAGNGYFVLNGVQQAPSFQVAANQLGNVRFVPTTTAGAQDQIEIRAFDGYAWGSWETMWIAAMPNALPVVNAANLSPSHGSGFVAASSMFLASDADNDAMTQYEFRDNTAGHGYFRLNGVQQAASFQIAANQLANLQFVPTSVAGGQDQIDIRAFDGYGWSNWKSVTVGAVPNVAPTVAASGATLARGMASVSAASLIIANDVDGDTMSRYRFFDGTIGSGRFALGGTMQAENANIEITSAQLAGLQFTLGAPGTSDVVWAQVFDGFVWSNWTSFTVTAPANAAPAAVVSDRTPALGTSVLAASSLFSTTDADSDPITAYKFFDGTQGSGHFRKNGIDQAELVNIDVSAAELGTTEFVLGGGSDVLWVQVFDGTSWSSWKSFTVFPPQNNAPVIAVNTNSLNPAHGTATVAASSFFSATDAENDAITQYRFFDGNAGNGRFELGGAPQVELANITITTSDLANFRYRTSTTGTGDTLWVQAFDGTSWSAWKSFTVNAPANIVPVVNVQNLTPAHTDAFIAGGGLFTVSDPDDVSMAKFRFFDGTAGNGRFQLNGQDQVELTNIEINGSDLANFRYRTSTTGAGDTLWVQAFDGTAWSVWKSFTVAALPNNAPVVTVNQASLSPAHGTATVAASSFFSVADADNDTITKFRFFDGNAGNGRFQLNGLDQVELTNIEINASDLANFRYRTSTAGTGDTLWVQAFDGAAWSAWKSFNVAPANTPPVVTVSNRTVNANTSITAASLFSVADGDNDTITKYQFWDSTPGGGAFRINGAVQAVNANIDVMANQLAVTDFLSAGAAATDQLWARAYDGTAWGEWKPFSVTTLAPV